MWALVLFFPALIGLYFNLTNAQHASRPDRDAPKIEGETIRYDVLFGEDSEMYIVAVNDPQDSQWMIPGTHPVS